jgi:signal transduction histidine kinase
VQVAVLRIAGEALTNAVRHAAASRCVLRLQVNRAVQLEIHDDGVGGAHLLGPGLGLTSMRGRAEELGGRCDVRPAAGGGTLVIATLPVSP